MYTKNLTFQHFDDLHRVQDSPLSLILVLVMSAMWFPCIVSCWLMFEVVLYRFRHTSPRSSTKYDVLYLLEIISDLITVTVFAVKIYSCQGFGIDLESSYNIFCKLLTATFCFFYGLSTDFIVLQSIIRYLAVYHPFALEKFMTFRTEAVCLAFMIFMSLLSALTFPINKSIYVLFYSDGSQIQMCGSKPGTASIYELFPFLLHAVLHLILPGLFASFLLMWSCMKTAIDSKLKRHPRTSIVEPLKGWKISHAVAAMRSNTVTAISLLQGLPACIFYFLYMFTEGNPHVTRSLYYIGTLLTLLPRCFHYWILMNFSPTFRESSYLTFHQSNGLLQKLLNLRTSLRADFFRVFSRTPPTNMTLTTTCTSRDSTISPTSDIDRPSYSEAKKNDTMPIQPRYLFTTCYHEESEADSLDEPEK